MDKFEAHKIKFFCYNICVPCERSDLIFVIGSQTLHRPILQCLESLRAGAFVRRPKPRQRGFAKTATIGRARSPSASSRGAAETHPTLAACTQHQRIGFRGKAANFTQRKTEYDGASRGNHAAYPLFLFFVKVLSGTCHETGFRGCAAFLFRAEAAVSCIVGAERRPINGHQMPALRNGV